MVWLAAVCLVWAGMVLGISFLETPVKFTAPSVTLPIGLDVGRHVFGMFNKVEIGLVLLCAVLLWMRYPPFTVWWPLLFIGLVVVLQTLWLLPLLDSRVELILSGQSPPPAPFHIVYVVLEFLKLALLLTAGIQFILIHGRQALGGQ